MIYSRLSKGMKKGEFLFAIAFTLFMMTTLFELTAFSIFTKEQDALIGLFLKIVRYGAYFLCLLKMLLKVSYGYKRFLVFSLCVIVTVLGYLGNLNQMLVLYTLIFMAADDMDSNLIIKISLVTQLLILFISVGSAVSGLIEDVVWEPEVRARHFLGFDWVTTSAILALFAELEFVYLKKGKLNMFSYLVMIVFNGWLYVMTNSRMAFSMSVVFLTFFYFTGKKNSGNAIINRFPHCFTLFPAGIALFAVLLHVNYQETWKFYWELNQILSNRLILGRDAFQKYGLTLFGTSIKWVGNSVDGIDGVYNYVDCSYLQILLEYGIVILALILVLYSLIIYSAYRQKKYYLCWIIVFILVFCVTEPRLIKLAFNPFLLLSVTERRKKLNQGRHWNGTETEIING